ncbi:LOW QUALITY PROTEIN: hypothetical protein MXB_2183 [Myxobolus squamalis]|nr:LOW QUALITY PROTEIN: hypothetical protein MXB_2183 [Myxobolus squamalis]
MNFDLAIETLKNMKMGKTVNYFCKKNSIKNTIYGANVILVEGLMTFYPKKLGIIFNCIVLLLDLKIFVETDSDLRLCRRLRISVIRDMNERGRDLNAILKQYCMFVKPVTYI